jgi:high-affinity Fe2+/Pb2+ permease
VGRRFKAIYTAVSMIFANTAVAATGLRMPWNEEAALYAVYGASAGVCAAITAGMLVMWAARKNQN